MSSALFTPFPLRNLTLRNRIVVSPMCQYSAVDGNATDWHLQHLGNLSLSGAGLLMIEATAVTAQGRITLSDLGLYSDDNEASLARALKICRTYGNTPIGIQLAHAGRKASVHVPWQGGKALTADEGAWETVAPSAIAFDEAWHTPQALDRSGLERITAAFVKASKRATRLGIDLAELHAAHGYLLHEFFSPLSNRREDEYGGSLDNRLRFPLEVAAALRAAWPAEKPLGARISGSDWIDGGATVDDAVVFAARLKQLGFDYVCVSSGGNAAKARIPVGPGYQVPFAARVRKESGMATRAVGMIVTPEQAEQLIDNGDADLVALARGFLDDPRWAWHAADALGGTVNYPPQYERSRANFWPGAKLKHPVA